MEIIRSPIQQEVLVGVHWGNVGDVVGKRVGLTVGFDGDLVGENVGFVGDVVGDLVGKVVGKKHSLYLDPVKILLGEMMTRPIQ